MNKGFTYSYWFEKGNDGKDYWMFTTSGNGDDPNNFDVPELEILIRWSAKGSSYSDWINSIVGIGIGSTGGIDFHFADGTVSPAQAYVGECYEFLDALGVFSIGYVMSIANHNTGPVEWMPPISDIFPTSETTKLSNSQLSKEAEDLRKYTYLDIQSRPGTKVKPVYVNGEPFNGYYFDKEQVKKYLPEGSIWTIDDIEVDRFSSEVYLVELPGIRFNSVSFAHAD